MYRMVRAAPMRAAWTLARTAASPRVGPTVRCSTISTGTGSAPARMRRASSLASFWLKAPVMTVEPPVMPSLQPISGETWGLEMTFSSRVMATRRAGSPAGAQAAFPVSASQAPCPSPRNSTSTCQPPPGNAALAVRTPSPVSRGRSQADALAVLVGKDQPVLLAARGDCRDRGRVARLDTEDGMKGELGRLADDGHGLVGVLQPGQLDDDAPVTRPLQGRLGHPELVDPPAEHLEGAVHRVAVDLLPAAIHGLEGDLCPTPQVETEAGRPRARSGRRSPQHG